MYPSGNLPVVKNSSKGTACAAKGIGLGGGLGIRRVVAFTSAHSTERSRGRQGDSCRLQEWSRRTEKKKGKSPLGLLPSFEPASSAYNQFTRGAHTELA